MTMNRRGATLVVFGLLLLPLVFLASLFLDLGRVYAFRSEVQLAADAAALAGASALVDGDEDGGIVTARVHQFVNENRIGDGHAQVDSLVIDHDAGTLYLVLGYESGPLMLAGSGIRLHVRAGARVTEETVVAEDGIATTVKKLHLK
jgi:hypothetical protein